MPDAVFVQPHYDDIALSCGGTVAQLAASGSPLIVTVCGGLPGEQLTDFARQQHAWWRLDATSVVEARRAEDECAARELGASVRVLSLDYPDAIYRRAEYASEEALFGRLVEADAALVDELAGRLEGLGEPLVMPLAVGNHVDHQWTFLAARELHKRGREVWLYADLPYALQPGALEARLSELALGAPVERDLTAGDFERRWRAIECYRSQLPVLFRSIGDARGRFEEFTRSGDRLRERFWRFDATEETST